MQVSFPDYGVFADVRSPHPTSAHGSLARSLRGQPTRVERHRTRAPPPRVAGRRQGAWLPDSRAKWCRPRRRARRYSAPPPGPREDRRVRRHPCSPSSDRALQYAAEEADRLSHDHIGTDHLLLGLLREERSVAAEVLTARGLRVEAVREAIVSLHSGGERLESPAPPSTPANTYEWPRIPFVPSRTVHILYSGMRWPEQPAINYAGTVFSAYGFTLEDIIVRAWEGNRWHVDITPGLRDAARFDFLLVLPQQEAVATCLGLLQSAIEQHFEAEVPRERRMRDVYVLT